MSREVNPPTCTKPNTACASPACLVEERCLFGAETSSTDIQELVEARRKLAPLAAQGEDHIWRPAKLACDAMDKAAAALSSLEKERDEALRERNAARVQNHVFISDRNAVTARAEGAESALSAQQDLIRRMVEGLEWTAAFAEMRAADGSKTFAKVARGALRTIAAKAADLARSAQEGDR